MTNQIEKLKALRSQHLKVQHGITFYPYQAQVSDAIIGALLRNLMITAGASEAEVKKLEPVEIDVEFSRQSGKTTAVVHTLDFIMIFFPVMFKRQIEIVLGAPQADQFKTDFDRLKDALRRSEGDLLSGDIYEYGDEVRAKEQSNARNLVLPNRAACYVLPINQVSKIESKSADLIVIEEAQDVNDKTMTTSLFPMGSTTNAPRILIGTAGTRKCYFKRQIDLGRALVYPWQTIASQRRETYKATGDARHLIYEQFVKAEARKLGEDSDEFQRPYNLKWLIGTGHFTTREELDRLVTERGRTFRDTTNECFAGIDTAKHPDSTIVTILRKKAGSNRKELINWLELRGENYADQFEIIRQFLGNYNIVAVAIDSTGQGDFMPDMFARETNWQDERSGLYRGKFSAVFKDVIYKNLKVSIKELLTDLPRLDTREAERFTEQLLDLQQEYKGQLLSVRHTDDANAHDDYPDSWALAEYAYARYNEGGVSIGIAENAEPVKETNEDLWADDWNQ